MVQGFKNLKDKLALDNVAKPAKLLWRYFCESCTGRATYAPEPYEFSTITCENCGAGCAYQPQNWLKITDKEELASINTPSPQGEI